MIDQQEFHSDIRANFLDFISGLFFSAARLVAILLLVAAFQSSASARPTWEQVPGVYRIQFGSFRITVLSDGTALRDVPAITNKPDEVRDAYHAAHEVLPTELSINCFLIDTGAHKILVDTGAGELFGPHSGKLIKALLAAGYSPDSIDTILLTHIHGDHSGGLSIGGKRLFRNAIVRVDRHDAEYWLDAAAEAGAPAALKKTFAQSHQTLDPYTKAGRLKPFDGQTALFHGITSVPEYGHTPGLSGYMVESDGHRLLLWGDIIHSAESQFRDPAVAVEYDVDQDAAIATRRLQLARAAAEGYLVGGAHLSFPGLGHVRAEGDGYAWMPAPYSIDFLPK